MLLPGPLNYPDPEKTVVLPANHHPPLLEVRGRARGQRSSEAGRAGLEISAQGRTVVARKSLQLQDLSRDTKHPTQEVATDEVWTFNLMTMWERVAQILLQV